MAPVVRTPRDEDEMRAIWAMLSRAFGWPEADFARWASGPPPERVLAAFVDDEPVACARVREFGQWFGGRRIPLGGFSPVGVAAEFRGRGLGSLITTSQFPLLRERGEVLAGLYPATNALYRKVGFELSGVWAMHKTRTRELQHLPLGRGTPTRRATEADFPAVEACYARVARNLPGFLDRGRNWWDQRIFAADAQQIYVVDGDDGDVAGYVRYTMRWPPQASTAVIDVAELLADDPIVAHTLWRLVGSSSSIAADCTIVGPPEHPLSLSLPEQDLATASEWRWMTRLIDAPGAIAARGYPPNTTATVALRVHDAQCEWNTGRWQFVLDAGEARLERGGDGTIELGIGALSSLYTGYASPWQLASAGLLHGGTAPRSTPRSRPRSRGRRPGCPTSTDARRSSAVSRKRVTGQVPSVVFEITVCVIARAGSCTLRNDTPASIPTRLTIGFVGWIQNPSPYRCPFSSVSLRGRTISATQSALDDARREERVPERVQIRDGRVHTAVTARADREMEHVRARVLVVEVAERGAGGELVGPEELGVAHPRAARRPARARGRGTARHSPARRSTRARRTRRCSTRTACRPRTSSDGRRAPRGTARSSRACAPTR